MEVCRSKSGGLTAPVAVGRNNARFLWKRISAETKGESDVLAAAWEIGKALWKR